MNIGQKSVKFCKEFSRFNCSLAHKPSFSGSSRWFPLKVLFCRLVFCNLNSFDILSLLRNLIKNFLNTEKAITLGYKQRKKLYLIKCFQTYRVIISILIICSVSTCLVGSVIFLFVLNPDGHMRWLVYNNCKSSKKTIGMKFGCLFIDLLCLHKEVY